MDVTLLDVTAERVLRRKTLVQLVQECYPDKKGSLLWVAGFERDTCLFNQDSDFYYFFGIEEPAVVAIQSLEESGIEWCVPDYAIDRSVWCSTTYDASMLVALGVDKIAFLGKKVSGYSLDAWCTEEHVVHLCAYLKNRVQKKEYIFTALTNLSLEKRVFIERLSAFVPGFESLLIDISSLIASLRRKKSEHELEMLYQAVDITALAHKTVASVIKEGIAENDVQAVVDYIFAENKARPAYPTIVGSGKNATILHYGVNNEELALTGLTVVDAGASFGHYCADITRTYPTNGKFSARQKKVYQDVLDAQTYVAQLAKPGMYLRNAQSPDLCLNTRAKQFLKERGYDVEKQFPHGIGHFVGLDVHDVGDRAEPLAVGDVITIEPGIYIKEEALGVRIEDMYWIVEDGNVCLSDAIAKEVTDVELSMKESVI